MSGLPDNLIELLEDNVAAVPEQVAYTFLNNGDFTNSNEITYRELSQQAKVIATLIQQKAVPGDRILLVYAPGLDFIAAFLGCLYAGTIAVPCYPPQAQELANKLQLIINNSLPTLCLSTTDIIQKLKQLEHGIHPAQNSLLIKINELLGHHAYEKMHEHTEWHFADLPWVATDHLTSALANHWQTPIVKPDHLALLQYTSGSTGDPKGVMVSHGNLLHNLQTIYNQCELDPSCQTVSWLPPYHDMGLIGSILQTIYGRFPCRLMSPMAFLKYPVRWLQAISHFRANISVAPNFAYDMCVEKISEEDRATLNLSSWDLALNGAEPIRAETIDRFVKTFAPQGFRREAFYPCYGMAETTLLVAGTKRKAAPVITVIDQVILEEQRVAPAKSAETAHVLVSSGQPAPSFELLIVNPDSKERCTDNEIGEIWVSGPSVTHGYWQQPALTHECFQAYTSDGKGPFLRTGDLGFLQNKELFVAGRLKDLIIIRGRNYYPQDIEATIIQSHPLLQGSSVAAFAVDKLGEERLVIIAEINPRLTHDDVNDIFATIKQAIAETFNLRVYAITLIPLRTQKKTTSGKLRRRLTRSLFLEGKLKNLHTWIDKAITAAPSTKTSLPMELQQWLKQWIASKLRLTPEEVDFNKPLSVLGFDSILATELAGELERKIGITVDPALLADKASINSLIEHFSSNQFKAPIKAHFSETDIINFGRIDTLPGLIQLRQNRADVEKMGGKDLFFNVNSGTSRNTTVLNGKEYINYCGYNYLGMSGDPYVNQAAITAIEMYGTSASASRLIAGEKPLHGQLERAIADLIGVDDCVVFSAGHPTNIAAITKLCGPNDLIVHDILMHNSGYQGAVFSGAKRIAFPHNDYEALENILRTHRHQYERTLIITEGVYSMDGDIPDIRKFVELKKRYHTFLMIDEAHSIGTIGKTGAGVREYFNLNPKNVDVWMGTLSKSFGSCGGYLAGSNDLIEFLKFTADGFVYSAAISPANTAAALASVQLMQREPERVHALQQRSKQLLTRLQKAGINTGLSHDSPVIPVIVGTADKAIHLSAFLKARGIYALPIFYPAVEKNQARVRFFINSTHTEEQINYTADMVIAALAKTTEACEI